MLTVGALLRNDVAKRLRLFLTTASRPFWAASRPFRAVSGFLRHRRGVAAVEFALLLPVLVLLYAGAGELAQAVITSRKVELLSRTLADLAARQSTSSQATSTPAPSTALKQSTLQQMFNASMAILAPGSMTPLKMTLSAVDVVNKSNGLCCDFKVRWSYTQSGTLRPCGTPLQQVSPSTTPTPTTVSNALVPPVLSLPFSLSVLIADVSYTYNGPFSSQWIDFTSGMARTSYMYPRTPGQVIAQGPLSPSGTQSGAICY